jgi:tRNA threonylcarbamoyladenosine biosynthesis protein TsaB
MLILAIETATLGGSVCLARGDEILAAITGDPKISHSNSLLRDINKLLHTTGLSLNDIDLFAAAAGPGSFTGLRIGLATCKAFAKTLDRPGIGIPTLHAVAHAAGPSKATVALLPAGRGEVFAHLLSVSNEGEVKPLDAPAHLPPAAMIEKYAGLTSLIWTGPAARLHRDLIARAAAAKGIEFKEDVAEKGIGFSEQQTVDAIGLPAWTLASKDNFAKDIAALALYRFRRGEMDQPESVRAIYVRPSDAELKA